MFDRVLNTPVYNSFMIESLSYRNQSTDLLYKSMNWFLYDRDLRNEIVKVPNTKDSENF